MPTHGKSRSRRSRRSFSRDNRRALGICLIFGAVVAVGLGTAIRQTPKTATTTAVRGAANIPATDDLTTGSIVFVPIYGNTCRSRLIDNATWRIRDNGLVDCRAALTHNAYDGPLGWSASRLDVIRHGFSNR